MNIHTKPGSKVIWANRNAGREGDQNHAAAHLQFGKEYTVAAIDIGSYYTDVYLTEVPDVPFNSVLFENIIPSMTFSEAFKLAGKLNKAVARAEWNGFYIYHGMDNILMLAYKNGTNIPYIMQVVDAIANDWVLVDYPYHGELAT